MRKVASFITEQLQAWGVTRIYGVTGDALFAFLDSLGKQNSIHYVPCKHEAAAALMASAEAKLTGRPAVCIATTGPGTVNLLNGLADAWADHVPVVAITGQVETYKMGGAYKQYVPQEDLMRPLCKYTTTVTHPKAIGSILHKAFTTAAQQKGVAHVAICKDVFEEMTSAEITPELPRVSQAVRPDRIEMEHAAQQLLLAKRPLVLVGAGGRADAESCRRFAETLGAGILLSLGAKGSIEDSHPLVLGGLGEGGSEAALQALAEADLLVILGASWFPQSFIPKHLPIIQMDSHSESIHAQPHLVSVTANLDDVLPLWQRRLEMRAVEHAWEEQVEKWHARFWEETQSITNQGGSEQIKPETLLHTLGRLVKDDAIIALDTGEHTLWFNRAFRTRAQTPLFSGKWRTMGFGLPAAIAAKLTHPKQQVVCITGDGGLQMHLAELMTAVEQHTEFLLIVVNNASLGLEEIKMKQAGYRSFGTKLHNPDFVMWAQACGVSGRHVRTVGDLSSAISEALSTNELTLLDVTCTSPTLTERKKQIPFQAQA
ncbi:thiamine pyrophosphate-binding protein [Brevibacillus nitrificans]|uniref:Thiamine pyrophosphate-binding protein n=1 Tax=Brevibacillus nitrificans TaxID=651560 RepID=A0A3M8DQ84_9BACL|nr:thiamine pyrophosphate-binding protein [Brevibacillus nitrificans]RNB89177.1 thiamine pyrophosphate-binding protein [Brevibacillus nitrificans]